VPPTDGWSSLANPKRRSCMATVTRMRMLEAAIFQGLSWSPVTDVRALLSFPFMVNAMEAGTIVAVMAGVTGWFMVLRRQTFAGHTLSVVAFTGAAAAGFAGVPVALGYFSVCGLGALALAAFGGSRRSLSVESAATGSLQALALALGFVFVSSTTGCSTGSTRCSSAPSSASPADR